MGRGPSKQASHEYLLLGRWPLAGNTKHMLAAKLQGYSGRGLSALQFEHSRCWLFHGPVHLRLARAGSELRCEK